MKKTFQCGHTGKGSFCHRCATERRVDLLKQAATQELKSIQEEKRKAAAEAGVDLAGMPKQVINKSLEIINGLKQGVPYTQYFGKRLVRRDMISIPIGRDYRMLCRDEAGGVTPLEVLSHEAYNRRVRAAMSGRI